MYFAIYFGMTLSLSIYIYLYISLSLYIYILIPVCGQGTKCLEVLASAPFGKLNGVSPQSSETEEFTCKNWDFSSANDGDS